MNWLVGLFLSSESQSIRDEMPVFCSVIGCKNNAVRNKNLSFHRIPQVNTLPSQIDTSKRRRAAWLQALNRNVDPAQIPYLRVCSVHFISGKSSDAPFSVCLFIGSLDPNQMINIDIRFFLLHQFMVLIVSSFRWQNDAMLTIVSVLQFFAEPTMLCVLQEKRKRATNRIRTGFPASAWDIERRRSPNQPVHATNDCSDDSS